MEKEWSGGDRIGVDGNAHDSLITHSMMGCACMSWLTGLLLMSLACLQQQQLDAVVPPYSQPGDDTPTDTGAGTGGDIYLFWRRKNHFVRNYRCLGLLPTRSQCLVSVGGST